ncbi:MAG: aminotransferase class V-fold PLP-dependent enzyme [Porticoccaceae bacterium]|nr:aminotransferase class V-fold PLP-dependent enzyme [Porticoccaceae bacterium]
MIANRFVDQQGIYLLSHSVGLPLKSSLAGARDAFWQPWLGADEHIWSQWLGQIEHFRDQLGLLLNSDSCNFCPQTTISSAVNKIIFSLSARSDKNIILMSEEDFPSVAYALQQACGLDYQVRYIPAGVDLNDMSIWDEYLTDDVALVLITQVQSNNGVQLPVDAITAIAAHRSIRSIVDIAQAIGILPIDIQTGSADFIVGSCVKWLSGGPGAAFLWVSPDIIEQCHPQNVGWFSHEDPFEFDIHNFRYAKDALRFWGGTPSVYPFCVASSNLEFVNSFGVAVLREHNVQLCQQIIDSLDQDELMSPAIANQRSGTLIVHFGKRHQQITNSLRREGIKFDSRSKGIRLSPHIYNTEDQISTLVQHIEDSR